MAVSLVSHALIPLADLRDEVKVASGKDDLLNACINRSTEVIELFLRRRIVKRGALTEYHTVDRRDGHMLQLRHYPVDSVTSVHEDYDRVYGASALLTVNVDFLLWAASGKLERIEVASSGAIQRLNWEWGERAIKVVYEPGVLQANVPWNIQDVCRRHAAVLYFAHQRRMHGVTTRQDETGNFTTFGAETLTATMKRDLAGEAELYRGRASFQVN